MLYHTGLVNFRNEQTGLLNFPHGKTEFLDDAFNLPLRHHTPIGLLVEQLNIHVSYFRCLEWWSYTSIPTYVFMALRLIN
jgi:hypothetical protein